MAAKYFAADLPSSHNSRDGINRSKHGCPQTNSLQPDPGMGSVGQNSIFSEHGHVTYQIKENQGCNNMAAKYFVRKPPPPPPTNLGMGSIGKNSTYS